MNFQQIKISKISESKTNTRGKITKKSIKDLIASIKEKGVLMPIIVRIMHHPDCCYNTGNKCDLDCTKKNIVYEVVAGNRRLLAAKAAGLKEVPVQVKELNDDEVKEIQVIENLQREDVHPIEEGFAYRELIDKSKYDVNNIALRVGKSETYIRYRIFLTNLIPDAIKAFREGTIIDGHAILISKLSPEDQKEALEYTCDEWSEISVPVEDLKGWIEDKIYNALDNQPWLKNKEANAAVGVCTKCPPNIPTLFGEVKEGACTDKSCWDVKMKKYINFMMKKDDLLKITDEYFSNSKKILSKNYYTSLSTKKKDHCKFAKQAIMVEGKKKGIIKWICADSNCKKHKDEHSEADVVITPEEKQKRKDEEIKAKAKREDDEKKDDKKRMKAINKIKYPITDQSFDVLFKMFKEYEDYAEAIVEAHGWKVLTSKSNYGDKKDEPDHDKTLTEKIKKMSREEKLQLMVEGLVRNAWLGDEEEYIKLLNKL